MNRTGLFIALGLALVIGVVFGIYPELDLKLAALFYDPATKSFPLKQDAIAVFAALSAGAWLFQRWLKKRRAKTGCDTCAAATHARMDARGSRSSSRPEASSR